MKSVSNNMRQVIASRGNGQQVNLSAYTHRGLGGQTEKPLAPRPVAVNSFEDELANLRAAAAAVQRIRLSAQRELEMVKRVRADAQRYQQETETKARSQAQQLILRARLASQKEIEELIRKAGAEIQKVLADIRVIRITAQEELAAQRKFTNAARILTLSLGLQKENEEPAVGKKKKQLVGKK